MKHIGFPSKPEYSLFSCQQERVKRQLNQMLLHWNHQSCIYFPYLPQHQHAPQIAAFEDITFEFCECIDAKTGEEVRHPKGECVVPGLVVVKIIYTREEACRRKEEDKEVSEAFRKTNKQVGLDDESSRCSERRRRVCAGGREGKRESRHSADCHASSFFSVRAHQKRGALLCGGRHMRPSLENSHEF